MSTPGAICARSITIPPDVFDRQGRDEWADDGGKDAWMRARRIARQILKEHKPEPLDPKVDAWIHEQVRLH